VPDAPMPDPATSLSDIIRNRHSARAPYDPSRPLPEADLEAILKAARWAPTAHNMQNYEVIVVDDPLTLTAIGRIQSGSSAEFVRENHAQLSIRTTSHSRGYAPGALTSQISPPEEPLRFFRRDWRKVMKSREAFGAIALACAMLVVGCGTSQTTGSTATPTAVPSAVATANGTATPNATATPKATTTPTPKPTAAAVVARYPAACQAVNLGTAGEWSQAEQHWVTAEEQASSAGD